MATLANVAGLVKAAWPTGTVTRDADGIPRYTLSQGDVLRLRGVLAGLLKDTGGKPLFRVSGIDTVVAPVALERFGIPLAIGLLGVFALGRMSAGSR